MTTPPAVLAPALPARFLSFLLVALAVRFGTVVLGLWLATLRPFPLPDDPAAIATRERILGGSARVVEPWYRWDALWYAYVAERGYADAGDQTGKLGVAFLPAMPATLAAGEALGLNPFGFGLAVVNVLGAIGAAVFAQVAAKLLNDAKSGWSALALLLAFPTAFFFSAPYNESFGLCFTAVALRAWQTQRPVIGGFAALGNSLARLTGVAVGVAALVDWGLHRRRSEVSRAVWIAMGSFAGIVLFWVYLWQTVGDPFAGLKAHAMWGRPELSWKNPFRAVESIYDPELPHWGEAFLVIGAALLGIRSWLRRGAFWGTVTLVPIAQMLASGTLLSGHRVVLAALPAFVELADVLRERRMLLFATFLGFGFAQLVLLNRFVTWRFAG